MERNIDMINYDLLLPEKKYYLVYYGNSYELLHKRFSAMEYADDFIDKLGEEYGLLQFVECREVIERRIK